MPEDNLNELMSNYKNMSMEDLGGALMARQTANRKRARRSQKREDRVMKILAVLLGGQAVFQETVKKRNSELDSLHTIANLKNKKMAEDMRIVGGILQSIPEEILVGGDALAQYNKETPEGRRIQNNFRSNVYPIILARMTQVDKEGVESRKLSGDLEGDIYDIIDDIIAPYYLAKTKGGKSRAHMLLEAGEKYFDDPNITGTEVFRTLLGISEDDVAAKRAIRLNNKKEKVRGQTGWFNVPGLISSVFKGEPTVFKRITDDKQSELQSVLEKNIRIGEFLTPYYAESMASWDNNRNYYNEALGIDAITNRNIGGYQETSMRQFIYQTLEAANGISAGAKSRLGSVIYAEGKDSLMRQAEEAEQLLRGLYGTEDQRTQLDMRFGDEFAKTWGSLRRVVGDEGSEGYNLLESNYGVDLSRLNLEEKNIFTTAIMVREATDPVDPNNYHRMKGGKPRWDEGVPGKLELFESGQRDRRGIGIRRGIPKYNESNFVNSLFRIKAFTEGATIKGINDSGNVELNDGAKGLLGSDEDSQQKAGAQVVGTNLNSFAKKGEVELAGAAYDNLMSNNKAFRNQVMKTYGTYEIGRDASIAGELQFMPEESSIPPGMPIFADQAPSWKDPYSAHEDIYEKGQTGIQVIPGAIYGAGVRQMDRQSETLLERHFKGRSTATDRQLKQAMQRLNIDSLEDARNKYSVE